MNHHQVYLIFGLANPLNYEKYENFDHTRYIYTVSIVIIKFIVLLHGPYIRLVSVQFNLLFG